LKRYVLASSYGITWTESRHRGKSPALMALNRSRRWKSASAPAIFSASLPVRFSTPCRLWKWYFTQNRSPAALIHM